MPNIKINDGRERFFTEDFTGGINQFIHPSKLNDNEFPVFENLTARAIGVSLTGSYIEADKRKGFERYNTNPVAASPIRSIGEYISRNKTVNVQRLIASADADGGGPYLMYTDITGGEYTGSWNVINHAEYPDKLKYATMNDNFYVCNRNGGADVNKFYDGTNYLDVGCVPCDNGLLTLFPQTGGGSLSAGNYWYLVTFVYDNAQESSSMVRAVGDVAKNALLIGTTGNVSAGDSVKINTIPTGNFRVTQRKIYRTKHDDLSLVYYIGSINDNTTNSYTDGAADTDLSQGIDPYLLCGDMKRPFKSKYSVVHDKRMVQFSVTDDIFKPIPQTAIALTPQTTGGGMTVGNYVYRFYKIWAINAGGKIIYKVSSPQIKAVTLTSGKDSCDVKVSDDGWYNAVAVQRTSVGSTSDFLFSLTIVPTAGWPSLFGLPVNTTFNDKLSDAQRFSSTLWQALFSDKLIYPNKVTWSDVECPDLFSQGNELNVGDSNDEITGGFSRYSAIDVFKRNSIYRIMTATEIWQDRKIANIGAAYPESIVQMPDETYIFCGKKKVGTTEYPVFYEWDGNNAPREISTKIQPYLDTINLTEVEGAYDNTNKCVRFTYTINGGYKGEELVYDLIQRDTNGIGLWYFNHRNTADLELRCPFYTNGNKLLYGSESGYIMHQGVNNQDTLGSSNTVRQINSRIQSKTHEVAFGGLRIKKLMCNVVTSGAGAANGFNMFLGIGPTEQPISGTLQAGENRIRIPCNLNAKEFYIRFENAENINIKFRMIGWDYLVKNVRDSAGDVLGTPATPTLSTPTNGESDIDSDHAEFSWSAITGVTYQIQIASDINFNTILFDQNFIKYNNFTAPNNILSPLSTYYWRVRALNGAAWGSWSTVWSFVTISGTGIVYETESTNLFARMVIPPTPARKILINNLIKGLKTDGIWAKLDCFYMLAHETNTNGEALLNWVGNYCNCTLIVAPTFTIDRGFKGNGTSQYIQTNYNPTINAINFNQNSASIFSYSRTDVQENSVDCGTYPSGNVSTMIAPAWDSYPQRLFYVNDYGMLGGIHPGDSLGLFVASRDSTNAKLYQKGMILFNVATGSAAPISTSFTICAASLVGSVAYFSRRQISCAGIGGTLTDSDVVNFNFRIETYLDAIGARV